MTACRGRIVMLTADVRIDRRILLQADSLGADGWDVTIVAMPDPMRHDVASPRVLRIGAPRSSSRDRFLIWGQSMTSRILPMNGALMRWLKAITWSWIANPSEFYPRLFQPTIAGLAADVVVAHDLPMLPVGQWLAERTGARLVYDSHELWTEAAFPESWKRVWRDIEQQLIPTADLVVTVNDSIAGELSRRYRLARVEVITNAVPPWTGQPRSLRLACGIPAEGKVLLYQGSLSSGRQLEACVMATGMLRDRSVHLVLLGDGVLRGRIERVARKSGAAARIHILPAVPQMELLAWTASADAGLIPYVPNCLNNRLCTPNKLYEFIAAGLPILASDLPELRSIVVGDGLGMVAPLGSAALIAAAMDEFFRDAGRLEGWRAENLRVRERHAWPRQAERLCSLYRELAPSPA